MTAVAASGAARAAIVNSAVARTALANSPLSQTFSTASVAAGTHNLGSHRGNVWVIDFTNSTAGSSNSGALDTVLTPSTRFSWGNNATGVWTINAFYNNLRVVRDGTNLRVHTVNFVPC